MQPLHSQQETNCVIPAQDLLCVQAEFLPHSPPCAAYVVQVYTSVHYTVPLSFSLLICRNRKKRVYRSNPKNDLNICQSCTVCQRTSSLNQTGWKLNKYYPWPISGPTLPDCQCRDKSDSAQAYQPHLPAYAGKEKDTAWRPLSNIMASNTGLS